MTFLGKGFFAPLAAIVFLATSAWAAMAQPAEILSEGRNDFAWSCLPCHGAEGTGNGSMAQMLVKPPADLTQIAKKNGGSFPFWDIYEIVSGRSEVAGHQTLQMPNYWERYRGDESKDGFLPAEIRILLLTHYVESLQKK